ncbi:hypothetical protein NUW54_g4136 [Trametes sanguinea]|uniref:Uncharacterized protein n=1 Tax=Trametes sanguinea TaxID=158606 RepID=A0ACC1PYR6_9APHY|nr:hypothetical protein NUW54_g4136 [Trametes sanguinea]
MDQLAREDHTVVISCELGLNLDYLIERIWEELDLVKVYTKKRGAHPDLADPICLRKGATVECAIKNDDHLLRARELGRGEMSVRCRRILNGWASGRVQRYSPIAGGELPIRVGLGKSSKFNPHAQKVGLNHHVMDEDVVCECVAAAATSTLALAAKQGQPQFAVPCLRAIGILLRGHSQANGWRLTVFTK